MPRHQGTGPLGPTPHDRVAGRLSCPIPGGPCTSWPKHTLLLRAPRPLCRTPSRCVHAVCLLGLPLLCGWLFPCGTLCASRVCSNGADTAAGDQASPGVVLTPRARYHWAGQGSITSLISLILEPPLPIRDPHWLAGTTNLSVTGGLLVAGLLLMELMMSWEGGRHVSASLVCRFMSARADRRLRGVWNVLGSLRGGSTSSRDQKQGPHLEAALHGEGQGGWRHTDSQTEVPWHGEWLAEQARERSQRRAGSLQRLRPGQAQDKERAAGQTEGTALVPTRGPVRWVQGNMPGLRV